MQRLKDEFTRGLTTRERWLLGVGILLSLTGFMG